MWMPLVDMVIKHTNQDMDTYACSNATGMMQAYYNVGPPLNPDMHSSILT